MPEKAVVRRIFLACLVILGTIVVWGRMSQPALPRAPVPDLQLIDGRNFAFVDLQGNPLVITFWSSTCETCLKKTPEFKTLYRQFHPHGLELIAVAMSYDPPNRIVAFARDHDIPYPIALDIDGSIARAFDDVALTPTTFLLDTAGRIVFRHTGDFSIDTLSARIEKLLPPASTRVAANNAG